MPQEGPNNIPKQTKRYPKRAQKHCWIKTIKFESLSADFASLSAARNFQKGSQATSLETFDVFRAPRSSPEVPKSRFIGPVDVL